MEVCANKSSEDDVLFIPVPENFDMKFFRELRNAYKNTSHKKYILDLKNTKNIISCAIGMLLQMHDYTSKHNSEIHLINCDKQFKILLETVAIAQFFHISCR